MAQSVEGTGVNSKYLIANQLSSVGYVQNNNAWSCTVPSPAPETENSNQGMSSEGSSIVIAENGTVFNGDGQRITQKRKTINLFSGPYFDFGQSKPAQWSSDQGIEYHVEDCLLSFSGRQKYLLDLSHTIEDNYQDGRKNLLLSQIIILTGMGGVGKSETARAYIQAHRNKYKHIVWLNAESAQAMNSCVSDLATKAGLHNNSHEDRQGRWKKSKQSEPDTVQEIWDALCREQRVLIVFDNAERLSGEDGIKPYLPRTIKQGWEKPTVIVTSRNNKWPELEVLPLGGFSDEECFKFVNDQQLGLEGSNGDNGQEFLTQLNGILEGLPLSLDQALSYIRKENEDRALWGDPPMTIKGLLEKILERKDLHEILKRPLPPSSSYKDSSSFLMMNLTFEKLANKKDGSLALTCLKIMSHLNSEHIPKILLRALLKFDEHLNNDVTTALQILVQYSLITDRDTHFKMHRLVQSITAETPSSQLLPAHGTRNEPLGSAPSGFDTLLPAVVTNFHDYLHAMSRYSPNVEIILANALPFYQYFEEQNYLVILIEEFCLILVRHLSKAWIPDRAERVIQRILANEGNIERRKFEIWRGYIQARNGQHEQALETYQKIYNQVKQQIISKNDGKEAFQLLEIRHKIAKVLRNQGDLQNAYAVYNEVFISRTETLGPKNRKTFRTQFNMAGIQEARGLYKAALESYEKLAELQEQFLAPSHPDTLDTRFAIGSMLRVLGQTEKAMALHEENLSNQVTVGSSYEGAERGRLELVAILKDQGQLDEAQALVKQILDGYNNNGDKDVTRAKNGGNLIGAWFLLADILFRKGFIPESLSIYSRLLEQANQFSGERHSCTWAVKTNMGMLLREMGHVQEALALFQPVCKLQAELLGEDHHHTLTTKANIADALGKQGKFQDSLSLAQEVIRRLVPLFSSTHPATLAVKRTIAFALDGMERYDDAIRLYYQVMENASGLEKVLTACKISRALVRQDKCEEAIEILQEVLKNEGSAWMPSSDNTCMVVVKLDLVTALTKQGRFLDEAIRIHEEAIQVIEASLGPTNLKALINKIALGANYVKAGKAAEALQIFRKIVGSIIEVFGEESDFAVQIKNQIGVLSQELEAPEGAANLPAS